MHRPDPHPVVLEAKASTAQVRRAYDIFSVFYAGLVGWLEGKGIRAGLERLALRPGERVLEVGFGPGSALIEIARRVGDSGHVCGVDLSPRMVRRARQRLKAADLTEDHQCIREGDARHLPFPDDRFDAVFSSYMLDLLPLRDIDTVLSEFRRVLAPGGRLCLVGFSKRRPDRLTLWERVYRAVPAPSVAYLLGGCRPLLLEAAVRRAGFEGVRRSFVRAPLSTEILLGDKPVDRGSR